MFFSFSSRPTDPEFLTGWPEKQRINLVWPYSHAFISLRETELQAMLSGAVIQERRKLLNEFEIIYRSTQCGPTLVNTNQQYIHTVLNTNIIITEFKYHTNQIQPKMHGCSNARGRSKFKGTGNYKEID